MYKYDVSVIVPVYNNEKYIEECVQSILKQNYDTKLVQIIIVNDGSTDNSKEICEELSSKYENILLINKENTGVSESRNVGLKQAEGKYILFLDSDDMLEETSLKKLVNFFDIHYDEIDMVTYPMKIYENEKAKPKLHYRYKFYTEGTGIYDLNENPYLGQSNINTIIKNLGEQRVLFDKQMDYSEDEAFNTEILMKKKKIGFCQEATYIYRKNVGSATKNKSNPYYTFESLTRYNEKLIKKFQDENDRIPKYIQAIILNNFRWRIKRDEIFPYHYDDVRFKNALERLKNILSYVENGTILNMPAMSIYHKFFIFKMKDMKLDFYLGDHIFTIMNNDEVLFSSEKIEIAFTKFKIIDNKRISILGCIKSPLCEIIKPRVFIKYLTRDNEVKVKEISLDESTLSYYQSNIKTNTFYKFDCIIELDKVKKFEFYSLVKDTKLESDYYFTDVGIFNTVFGRYVAYTSDEKYLIYYRPNLNVFYIKEADKKEISVVKTKNKILYKKINPKINIYRCFASLNRNKEIWLYYDSPNMYDNGYYQFLHDFEMKDGVKRYYIFDGDNKKINEKFSKKERKNVIRYGSLKHKIAFLKSKKVITSDSVFNDYCPFKKSIRWYRDITNYDLIYLQHGILYANLVRMYGKEYTEISKIVISSEFEKQNLIKNYKYNEEDLICAGMPRFDMEKDNLKIRQESKNSVKKIIYAPSWRKYLVGELVNRSRLANMSEMQQSSFYKKNIEILTSERLKKILKDNDIIFEFKLHPNFSCYKELFQEACSENIRLGKDEVSPQRYDMLITDYSSFQFDFIKHDIPIIYFVPDLPEFKAGLHTYRKLDLPLEEAFGDVTYTSEDLINKIEYYIKNNFDVEPKYKERMDNFFFDISNSRDKIYNALKQD